MTLSQGICGPDLLIDDFSVIRTGWLDNLPKTFNEVGGKIRIINIKGIMDPLELHLSLILLIDP